MPHTHKATLSASSCLDLFDRQTAHFVCGASFFFQVSEEDKTAWTTKAQEQGYTVDAEIGDADVLVVLDADISEVRGDASQTACCGHRAERAAR